VQRQCLARPIAPEHGDDLARAYVDREPPNEKSISRRDIEIAGREHS
jgi:hypothetical protein